MNTSKQINIMVLVVFAAVLATGAYTLWDPSRADQAEDDQLGSTVERGAWLFSQNCRTCHGDVGEGGLAGNRFRPAPALNGLALGEDATDVEYANEYKRIFYTITCGRVGRQMPSWGQSQGGTLNDEQIKQLTIFILEGGEGGWEEAREFGIHGVPEFGDFGDDQYGMTLTGDVSETDTVITLNKVATEVEDAEGNVTFAPFLVQGDRLSIKDEDREDVEIMLIAPAREYTLAAPVSEDATEIRLTSVDRISVDDQISIGAETMVVKAVDASTGTLTVERPAAPEDEGDDDPDTDRAYDPETDNVSRPPVQPNQNTVDVERGAGNTDPTAHAAGTEVLKPPVPPTPEEQAVTERACGQTATAEGPSGPAEPPSATLTITAQGQEWDKDTLSAIAGVPLTLTVDNQDDGIDHNWAVWQGTEPEGDPLALTDIETGPVVQTLNFGPLEAGDYYYLCEVHPNMEGILTAYPPGEGPGGAATPGAATPAAGTPAAGTPAAGATGTVVASTPVATGTPAP